MVAQTELVIYPHRQLYVFKDFHRFLGAMDVGDDTTTSYFPQRKINMGKRSQAGHCFARGAVMGRLARGPVMGRDK